jgi:hypothetical protein
MYDRQPVSYLAVDFSAAADHQQATLVYFADFGRRQSLQYWRRFACLSGGGPGSYILN